MYAVITTAVMTLRPLPPPPPPPLILDRPWRHGPLSFLYSNLDDIVHSAYCADNAPDTSIMSSDTSRPTEPAITSSRITPEHIILLSPSLSRLSSRLV